MTFEVIETSRALGKPINLYRFSLGEIVYGYTDAETAIVHLGDTYEPTPLDRAAVNSSGSLDKSSITVTVPAETAIADLYRVYPPTDAVSLVILQGHKNDPTAEFLAIWVGRVLSASFAYHEAELTCEPVNTSLRRVGLRRHYQFGCPHALYGPQCRALQLARTVTATAGVLDGATLTLADGWEGIYPRTKFLGGMVSWEVDGSRTEQISIIGVGENFVRLGGAPQTLDDGMTILLAVGCNHQMTDCRDLHENINNYGGQPWIPLKSPLGNVNNYY